MLESVLGVVIVYRHSGVRLVLCDSVKVDNSVAKVKVIAGEADGAFTRKRSGVSGLGLRKTTMSPEAVR